MEEHPIYFTQPEITRILQKGKSQFRKVVTPQPINGLNPYFISDGFETKARKQPYKIGDVLWVKEHWLRCNKNNSYHFKADDYEYIGCATCDSDACGKWQPPITMPKEAARIWFKITNARIECLQAISEEDARREGIEFTYMARNYGEFYAKHYLIQNEKEYGYTVDYEVAFAKLWDCANRRKLGYRWKDNPFVWVFEFERIER